LKNPVTKVWTGEVTQGEGPEFKPQYCKKKKKKKRNNGCHRLAEREERRGRTHKRFLRQ
jgi:hypothetical protein